MHSKQVWEKMLSQIAGKLGFVRRAEVQEQLQFARSIGKRLDEHREVVQWIQDSGDLFAKSPWHLSHMAMQDDFLMRLYFMVYGSWPDDSVRYQKTREMVRPRPLVLGECSLPELREK